MKRCAAAMLALALAAGIPPAARGAAADATIRAKQAEIDATHHRLAAKRRLLDFERVRASDLASQLAQTDRGIAAVGATLNVLGAQVHQNQRRLDWNRIQLDAAKATLERQSGALRKRLVDAYEHGDLEYLNVLLSATSFSDFVERWDDIGFLVAANEKTVRERREAERAVAAATVALERRRLTLDRALVAQQQARYELASLADERRRLVAVAERERQVVAQQVAELEELSASEESALEQLIRERQREEDARRTAEREARRRAALLSGQALPEETPSGPPGSFAWPVSGPITSPFGLRTNPTGGGFERHEGIDIGAPSGATITASAAGRVIFAGWYGGYGNAVIIDHGSQVSTLYGHCSALFVANGQDVQRGQAIAAVGMTGHATGPHLHFEIRINGVPIDPTTKLR